MEDAQLALARLREDASTDVSPLLSRYQLRANLLDPILSPGLSLLSAHHLATGESAPLRTVYTLARIRGYKVIVQRLPTDMRLIPQLLKSLKALDESDWQGQYALLLWLSSVVLAPFDLGILGVETFETLYSVASQYLASSGIQRDAAALLMSRILTRDRALVDAAVTRFVSDFPVSSLSGFRLTGSLQVLAEVADRVSVVPTSVNHLLVEAMETIGRDEPLRYYESTIDAKLWLKILGRSALRNLDEFAEFGIAECFTLFDDASSRIRLAAAKYLAKISAKIPNADGVSEICQSLLDSLDVDVKHASPDYWNGALIALAEIVRRVKLIPKHILAAIVTDVLEFKGLHFTQDRIQTKIGTTVRDAACYVCWSIFRTTPDLDNDLRARLYASLIALACLDSEVNVRRAAAAALQEGLGRYSGSSGISPEETFHIMEHLNFHTVSLVTYCYLHLAPMFCQYDHFMTHLINHGVNSSSPDMRRLAARSIPMISKTIEVEAIIDALIEVPSRTAFHGKALALASVYSSSATRYRAEEAAELLHAHQESDLATEAILYLMPIKPSLAAGFLSRISTEEPNVIAAAEMMMERLPHDTIIHSILPVCEEKLTESRLFVSCIVKTPLSGQSLILKASRLPDPQSRALAVKRINMKSIVGTERIIAALNDYSVDERGDVGAWVREAALLKVEETKSENSDIRSAIWRMASESRQKLRVVSSKVLFELGEVPDRFDEDTSTYFFQILSWCPVYLRKIVTAGLVSAIGATAASLTTIEGSFNGLVRYIEGGNVWPISEIMSLNRATVEKSSEVVLTLRRLIVYGIEIDPWTRALAIAYNTTISTKQLESTVLDAIDILQIYAERSSKAFERLLGTVQRHPNGRARQRAAEALFELGYEDDILETADWTYSDYKKNAQKLSISYNDK